MGEYAIRKSDNVEVKIGTCESMHYLRADQRSQVRHLDGNVDPEGDAGSIGRAPCTTREEAEALALKLGRPLVHRNRRLVMAVTLKHDETTLYSFQHPDAGVPMVLKLDDEECPIVEVETWAADEMTPEDLQHWQFITAQLTRVVCHMTDLYEAACKLYREHDCRDILG